ncbi:MAG: hypothetical protein LC664_15145 [Flavobacteriales bacterium]|nr:hypothetical protein [Flavobacteriales bacterium]
MENLQSWIVPTAVVLVAVVAKFILEIYLPKSEDGKMPMKKIFINSFMGAALLYILGNMSFRLFTEPWSQDLMVFTYYQAFLFTVLTGFLLVMRIFNIFIDDFSKDSEHGEQRLKDLASHISIQN